MGLIQESDVTKLLQNQELMDELVGGLVEDSQVMDTLAEDIADKMEDTLEDDTELRQRLINAAVTNEAFKKKLVNKLIEEFS